MVEFAVIPVEALMAVGGVYLAEIAVDFGKEGKVSHLDELVAQVGGDREMGAVLREITCKAVVGRVEALVGEIESGVTEVELFDGEGARGAGGAEHAGYDELEFAHLVANLCSNGEGDGFVGRVTASIND